MNVVIFSAIVWLLKLMKYAIIARAILSFLPIQRDGVVIKLIYQITEPILAPIRRLIERSAFGNSMMLDFSPIIAFMIIGLVESIFARILL